MTESRDESGEDDHFDDDEDDEGYIESKPRSNQKTKKRAGTATAVAPSVVRLSFPFEANQERANLTP